MRCLPQLSAVAVAVMAVMTCAPVASAQTRDPDSVKITPIGFISFTGVTRSTNTGGGLPTNFGTIPYPNTAQGRIGETTLSAADTRLGFTANAPLTGGAVRGLFQGDFLGADPATGLAGANSHAFRLFLAYGTLSVGNWEVLGGQAWSWMTPNRRGLSAAPEDVFTTMNVDANLQAGLTWTRAAQVRVTYRPSDMVGVGVALENRDQFIGENEVLLPSAFAAQLAPQFDAGNNASPPGRLPDLIGKIAADPRIGDRHLHVESAVVLRRFAVATLDTGAAEFTKKSGRGQGVSLAANLELLRGLRVLANVYRSSGGGRYIGALGPDVVIQPSGTSVVVSNVDARSMLGGVEAGNRSTELSLYYSEATFRPNAFPDTTSVLAVKPTIGFAGANSPGNATRSIREVTAGFRQTIWSQPKLGAIQFLAQVSRVTRIAGFVPSGTPGRAQTTMIFGSLRYVLP